MSAQKFKKGDMVTIRSDLATGIAYGDGYALEKMLKFRGVATTITKVKGKYYFIKADNERFRWGDEMFLEEHSATDEEKLEKLIAQVKADHLERGDRMVRVVGKLSNGDVLTRFVNPTGEKYSSIDAFGLEKFSCKREREGRMLAHFDLSVVSDLEGVNG